MKTYKEKTEKNRLVIEYYDNPETPREGGNLGYFITIDSRYKSPDNHDELNNIIKEAGNYADDLKDHMKLIRKEFRRCYNLQDDEKIIDIYPVNKYEHGGVVYRLGVRYGFDYFNNGFYITTETSIKEAGAEVLNKEERKELIEKEIEVYNQYANGEVYKYTLYDNDGKIIDSSGSWYDIEDIKTQLGKEWENEDMEDYVDF